MIIKEIASVAGILFVIGGMLLLISIPFLIIPPRPLWAVRTALIGLFTATGSITTLLMVGIIAAIGSVSPPMALLLSPLVICGGGPLAYIAWESLHPGIWIPLWRWFSQANECIE